MPATRPLKTRSATRRWCALQRIAGAGERAARQRDSRQARRQQPGRLGQGPAGAQSMIRRAEERGEIKPGDTLIEATSGNTGIALAMAAAIQRLPHGADHAGGPVGRAGADHEGLRRRTGAHAARAAAWNTRATWPSRCRSEGKGRVLDQFANADNPRIHYETTGPELWRADRRPHHALRERDGHHRHHHRRFALPEGKEPGDAHHRRAARAKARAFRASASGRRSTCRRSTTRAASTRLVYVSQDDAEDMCRRLAREEGIFGGISAAGACGWRCEIAKTVENATIVFVVCDRGDRYLSTGVFPA